MKENCGNEWKTLRRGRGWADVSYFFEIQRGSPVGSMPRTCLWNGLTHFQRARIRDRHSAIKYDTIFLLDPLLLALSSSTRLTMDCLDQRTPLFYAFVLTWEFMENHAEYEVARHDLLCDMGSPASFCSGALTNQYQKKTNHCFCCENLKCCDLNVFWDFDKWLISKCWSQCFIGHIENAHEGLVI